VLCGGQRPSGREHLAPSTQTHTQTYVLEREKNSSCVRVENEASGIQEGENKVNEGGKRSGFQYQYLKVPFAYK
jgi:hypothetical protein